MIVNFLHHLERYEASLTWHKLREMSESERDRLKESFTLQTVDAVLDELENQLRILEARDETVAPKNLKALVSIMGFCLERLSFHTTSQYDEIFVTHLANKWMEYFLRVETLFQETDHMPQSVMRGWRTQWRAFVTKADKAGITLDNTWLLSCLKAGTDIPGLGTLFRQQPFYQEGLISLTFLPERQEDETREQWKVACEEAEKKAAAESSPMLSMAVVRNCPHLAFAMIKQAPCSALVWKNHFFRTVHDHVFYAYERASSNKEAVWFKLATWALEDAARRFARHDQAQWRSFCQSAEHALQERNTRLEKGLKALAEPLTAHRAEKEQEAREIQQSLLTLTLRLEELKQKNGLTTSSQSNVNTRARQRL